MLNFSSKSAGCRHTVKCAAGLLVAVGLSGAAIAQAPPPAPARAGGTGAAEAVDESGYKVLVPSATLAKNKITESRVKGEVQQVLVATENLLSDRGLKFDSYYTLFVFPMMTQTTPEALQVLPDRRNRFFRTELEICKNPEVHAHLVGMTFDQMSTIVQDNFHPAVRYNAMLIISSLNDQEISRYGGNLRVPEPMARALPFILAEFQKPANPDAIKVAALIGLSRHLEWDPHRANGSNPIPAALRAQVVNELLTLAQTKDPPAGRDAEGHLWFRRRAIEALGLACYARLETPVADALDQILRDESEPLSLRLTVAAALGRLNFQAPAKLDTPATTKELGYLALLACDAELNRLKKLNETESEHAARISGQGRTNSGGGAEGNFGAGDAAAIPDAMPMGIGGEAFGGAGGAFGGAGGAVTSDPKGYRFDLVRRRLRQQLYCVQFGLTGGEDFIPGKPPVAATPGLVEVKMPPRGMNAYAKPGDEKKLVSDVYDKVRKLADTCENKATDMITLEKELRKTMKALELITKKLTPPPAAAPPGARNPDVPVAVNAPAAAAGLPEAPPMAPVAAPAAAPAAVPAAAPPAATPAPAPAAPPAAGGVAAPAAAAAAP